MAKFLRSTRAFKDRFRHTCVIQVATVSTTADPYHPGSSNRVVDWSTLAASHTGIRCSAQRMTAEELAAAGKAGTVLGYDILLMAAADAPATLLDRDSTPAPETYHRVANVAVSGVVSDAGPYDIEQIIDLAGDGQLLRLELKRVQ